MEYVQCLLEAECVGGLKVTTSWMELKKAVLGKRYTLQDTSDKTIWTVKKVYESITVGPEFFERAHKTQRDIESCLK